MVVLRAMLAQLGFSDFWIQMVMRYVKLMSYSMEINGEVGE